MAMLRVCCCAWAFAWAFSGAVFAQNLLHQPPETTRIIPSIEGSDLYKTYCATCHGVDGKGGGPMAQALTAHVPNLTHISRRNHGKFPLEQIERYISGEESVTAAHGSREMPIWGPVFSQIEFDLDLGRVRIHNLAKYLETIQQ
jgi:mono/diheme cytochrome c family protein